MPSFEPVDPDDDRRLRTRAERFADCPALADLTTECLRSLVAEHGVDFATAVLFDRVIRSARHQAFIARIDALREEPPTGTLQGVTFAIAPGAFHREFPLVGADGRLLREVAAEFGCDTALIPVPSTGGLRKNAAVILDWLSQRTGPVILASLSKGAADLRLALADPRARRAFHDVVAWVSLCGMHDGTPLANALLARPIRAALVKLLFRWRGFDFAMVPDLCTGRDGLFAERFEPPPHLRLVNVIGFPLTRHMTNRRSRRWRRVLDPLGPNDGGVLLGDVCRLPGDLYPVWGADHYLCPRRFDMRSLATAILHDIAASIETSRASGRTRLSVPIEVA